jgi:hypothetical protein
MTFLEMILRGEGMQRYSLGAVVIGSSLGFAASGMAAGPVDYLRNYQLGLEYSNSSNYLHLSYKVDRQVGADPEVCKIDEADARSKICATPVDAGGGSGWGVILEQPFKKQGMFYFNADVGFSLRYLSGRWPNYDVPGQNVNLNQPLQNLSFNLVAAIIKPYVKFGITPEKYFPDILFTIGPSLQLSIGNVIINDVSEKVAFVSSSALIERNILNMLLANVEIVFMRFGEGSFGMFVASDHMGGRGTLFYPHKVDQMKDFMGYFSHKEGGVAYGFGLRIVMDWP